jgi:hypothetical protein
MNANLEKLLKMAKVTTTQNIEVRENFIMFKNGDSGFYPLAKIYDKYIEVLWLELNDIEMDLYVRRDNRGEYDWLARVPYENLNETEFEVYAKDLRETMFTNYKMAKAVSAARNEFWKTYHAVMEGK